jgi:hypothetical protein
LHNIITSIEYAIEHKVIALGTFLDIEGALERTSFDIIEEAAERHDSEPGICRRICAIWTAKTQMLYCH